ncbi:hypothetical protein [Streptomyces sp. DH8]|uniref:hypothetical protein n=1 Tax=Streptomyces sp. DH8 TaxID=2857008 RepID=UPI001E5B9B01|nr:hypothetical protein [Streptomyces sp. DH8]
MTEHGGAADQPQKTPRSRLADYAEMRGPVQSASSSEAIGETSGGGGEPAPSACEEPAPEAPGAEADESGALLDGPEVVARKREFARLLGEFRRTAVLVPLGDEPGLEEERGVLTADFNGIRFILAFSDEQALARYAQARGEFAREWSYRTVLGARLLDVAVPAAGVPCGVALDCADGTDGMVFPPVTGIVPDAAAVDREVGDEARAR